MRPDEDLPSVKHCARARRARARETHGEAECGACDLPDAGRGGCALERPGLLGIALSSSANTGRDTSPLLLVPLTAIALFILGLLVTGRALVPWSGRLRITGLVLLAGFVGPVMQIASTPPSSRRCSTRASRWEAIARAADEGRRYLFPPRWLRLR